MAAVEERSACQRHLLAGGPLRVGEVGLHAALGTIHQFGFGVVKGTGHFHAPFWSRVSEHHDRTQGVISSTVLHRERRGHLVSH
ncbi:Uncharacterised protein [Mycobacteroides abscessus subsp. massiliense]|nr:Uncharacterised protein [Mycobacteroides abscessus subsp. massiliense]